jgi:hypothetical protein
MWRREEKKEEIIGGLDSMRRILFVCDKVMDGRPDGATALNSSIREAKRIYLV